MKTNVIYDKDTQEIVLIEMNDVWVFPDSWELAQFGDGIEPALIDVNGRLYLKTNAMILDSKELKGQTNGWNL